MSFHCTPKKHNKENSDILESEKWLKAILLQLAHLYKVQVTLSSLISYTGQVRVSLLTVFSNNSAVVEWVLFQETLGRIVAVNIDLGQSIVSGWFLAPFMDARLKPW